MAPDPARDAESVAAWRELADELGQLLERYGWLIQGHDNVRRPADVAAVLARWKRQSDGSGCA